MVTEYQYIQFKFSVWHGFDDGIDFRTCFALWGFALFDAFYRQLDPFASELMNLDTFMIINQIWIY